MTRAEAFVTAARSWGQTPFKHMGREKGLAVDCVGLVLGAATEAGLLAFRPRAYARDLDCDYLTACLEECCRRLEPGEEPWPGDLLQFEIQGLPQHLGIRTGRDSFLHAWETVGRVAETPLSAWWAGRIAARWRLKGLEETF